MIPVTRTFLPPLDEIQEKIASIWESGQITNSGTFSKELVIRLEEYLGVQNLVLQANGTLALQLAIKALDLKGEIITTPYSYVATTNAILWEGCEPIFVDIDKQSLCIDPSLIEAAITPKTSAILATHVYGYPCDVERIQAIADHYGLKVIYDGAHAFGIKLNGQSLLAYGDCSTLSFHATKLFHTAEGGAVICKDETVANRLFLMSRFGHIGEDEYLDLGINAKLSELHAAVGLTILPKIGEIIEARRQCSAWYDECLKNLALQRPVSREGLEYNYAYYPVIFPDHASMMSAREALVNGGVMPRRYFHPSLNTLPFLSKAAKRPCPISESISQRVLCLPLYVGLDFKTIEKISSLLK